MSVEERVRNQIVFLDQELCKLMSNLRKFTLQGVAVLFELIMVSSRINTSKRDAARDVSHEQHLLKILTNIKLEQ